MSNVDISELEQVYEEKLAAYRSAFAKHTSDPYDADTRAAYATAAIDYKTAQSALHKAEQAEKERQKRGLADLERGREKAIRAWQQLSERHRNSSLRDLERDASDDNSVALTLLRSFPRDEGK